MVVQRGQGVLEDGDVQKPLEADLQDAQAAVHNEHQRGQQEGEGMAALEGQNGQEEAHGAAARVTHQQGGRLGVLPQVGQQSTNEHNACGGVIPQFLPVGQQEGADADHGKAGGKAVHAIGAVDHIDAGPDQDDDQDEVDGIGQVEAPAQEVDLRAVEVQVGHARHNGDDQIDQALFVLVPGSLGGIVKIAGEHGRNEQDGVDDVLCFKGHHGQRDQCDAEHEDEAGAPGLALGEFAVHGKRAAMVVGELIVEHRVHQRGQRKCKQKAQRIHGARVARKQLKHSFFLFPGAAEAVPVLSRLDTNEVYHARAKKSISGAMATPWADGLTFFAPLSIMGGQTPFRGYFFVSQENRRKRRRHETFT